jgi:hypothetical protein
VRRGWEGRWRIVPFAYGKSRRHGSAGYAAGPAAEPTIESGSHWNLVFRYVVLRRTTEGGRAQIKCSAERPSCGRGVETGTSGTLLRLLLEENLSLCLRDELGVLILLHSLWRRERR